MTECDKMKRESENLEKKMVIEAKKKEKKFSKSKKREKGWR